MMRRSAFILLAVWVCLPARAQEEWTLRRCIEQARENSITVQKSRLGTELNELSLREARAARLPNLSLSTGFFEQFGRTIDPTTNTFANQKIGSSRASLNTGLTLFNAGRINHTIQRARLNVEAAHLNDQSARDDLALNVALVYFQILFAQDQVDIARKRRELARQQIERTKALIEAGSLPANEILNFQSKLADAEQQVVAAENSLDAAYLQLRQMLRTDEDIRIRRVPVEARIEADIPDEETVFRAAVARLPAIRAAQLQVRSSRLGVKIAKSALWPTLTIGGSMSTNYSSLSKKLDGFEVVTIPQQVSINGSPAVLEVPRQIPVLKDNPFPNQLDENFGQSFGLNLSVPIYQNYRSAAAVQRARIAVRQAELDEMQARYNLRTTIQKAVHQARAARQQLRAAQKAYEAALAVLRNTQEKYDAGAAGAFELTTAKTNADIAENNLLSARYDLFFKRKILDFYLGKDLSR